MNTEEIELKKAEQARLAAEAKLARQERQQVPPEQVEQVKLEAYMRQAQSDIGDLLTGIMLLVFVALITVVAPISLYTACPVGGIIVGCAMWIPILSLTIGAWLLAKCRMRKEKNLNGKDSNRKES